MKIKKNIKIIFFLFVVILVDVAIVVLKPWKKETTKITYTNPIPLNYKISNEMSTFLGTERFDNYVENFLVRWDIKGASFALVKDGKLIYAKGYGFADEGEPMETKHIMRVASVSKLITATAVMKLHEQGKLNLNDKVFGENGILNDSIFLNIRDKRVKLITVEHLLRHRGGFSLRVGDPMFNPAIIARTLGTAQPLTMDDNVRYAAEGRLRSTPGASSSYSNLGYLILSKVVEKVSGEKFETFVQNEVLAPAGCYDIHISTNDNDNRRKNEVNYYEVHDAEPIESYDGSGRMLLKSRGGNDITGLYGAGAWLASPVELAKLVCAIDGKSGEETILSQKSINKMTAYHKSCMPIGWAKIDKDYNWVRTGSLSGTSAYIKRQNNGYTWVFLTNTSSWKGASFTYYINKEISSAMSRVKSWPNQDLFTSQPLPINISKNSSVKNDTLCY